MKRWLASACGILALGLAGCGGLRPEPPPDEPEELDPYRPLMAGRINAVLYPGAGPERMLAELALLGVRPGMDFGDFKAESGIDDWFAESQPAGGARYTSLTCGLSPVVDEDGRIRALFRARKRIDGRLHPELAISGP
jgi:hypothetical protein